MFFIKNLTKSPRNSDSMSRGSGVDVGSLIRGNHSNYLLGREALNELRVENQQLNYENNKLRTDLDLRNLQVNSLKRKLWEKQNELTQVISERDWFEKKTQNLEQNLHSIRTTNGNISLSAERVNPFYDPATKSPIKSPTKKSPN